MFKVTESMIIIFFFRQLFQRESIHEAPKHCLDMVIVKGG
jgi:hypothetical protein